MYRALFELFKTLQTECDHPKLPRILLDRVIEFSEADKGFIVVREADDFQERYHVAFDPKLRTEQKRQFSRSLVREVIRSGEPILSRDISIDQRFESIASVRQLGSASVLVVPLRHGSTVNAVIYQEKHGDPFGDTELAFAREFADMAGLTLHLAVERESLRKYKQDRETDVFQRYDFGKITTNHPKMLRMLEMVGRIAQSDATVLIRGDTGTGKELIAQAIYKNSARRHKPFVTLHCGALPETLLESELFGHKRGAFTGAHADRSGRIAIAHGGTLFIDEVAEIPLTTQAKLLRFFQFGEFQRIGSDRTEKVDVRIVAATHAPLDKLVESGQFRADLYYRLKVIEIRIPALAERQSDLSLLLDAFLFKFWPPRQGVPHLTPRAYEALLAHAFPGNVRELEHLVQRMCLLAHGPSLDLDVLPPEIAATQRHRHQTEVNSANSPVFLDYSNQELKLARRQATKHAVDHVEKAFLEGLLLRSDGNIKKAAELSGMQRTYIYKLLAKHHQDPQGI